MVDRARLSRAQGVWASLQALLRYDGERKEVVLASDRDYRVGDPILAWCGPQPNSRVRAAVLGFKVLS